MYDDEHTLVVDPVTTKEVVINGVVTPFDSEGKIHLTDSGVNKQQEMVKSPGFGARQIMVGLSSISHWLHTLG